MADEDKDTNRTDTATTGRAPAPSAPGIQRMADAQDKRAEATADRVEASRETLAADRAAATKPAKIGGADASEFEASGAVVEEGALKKIDVDHPAVDNNPRAGTTARQNQIDFNDPTLTDRKAVEQRLDQQS
jgi:hypothetical protein